MAPYKKAQLLGLSPVSLFLLVGALAVLYFFFRDIIAQYIVPVALGAALLFIAYTLAKGARFLRSPSGPAVFLVLLFLGIGLATFPLWRGTVSSLSVVNTGSGQYSLVTDFAGRIGSGQPFTYNLQTLWNAGGWDDAGLVGQVYRRVDGQLEQTPLNAWTLTNMGDGRGKLYTIDEKSYTLPLQPGQHTIEHLAITARINQDTSLSQTTAAYDACASAAQTEGPIAEYPERFSACLGTTLIKDTMRVGVCDTPTCAPKTFGELLADSWTAFLADLTRLFKNWRLF